MNEEVSLYFCIKTDTMGTKLIGPKFAENFIHWSAPISRAFGPDKDRLLWYRLYKGIESL